MVKANFDVVLQDHRVVCAGTQLKGAVYLDAPKVMSGSAVTVQLTGQEITRVQFERGDWSRKKMVPEKLKPAVKGLQSALSCFGDDNNYERHESKRGKNVILTLQAPVGSQDMIQGKKIEVGQYKLPFTIDLPDTLPTSMHVREGDEGSCEILYTLSAKLEGSGWFQDYKAERSIFVRAAAAPETEEPPVPFEGPPETMRIQLLRCKNVGEMTSCCRMDNTVLTCGRSSATVAMACRNDSTLGVSKVVAQLVQITKWEAGGYESNHEKVIVDQTFPDWNDLEPLSQEEMQQRNSLPRGGDDENKVKRELLEQLQSGAHQISLRVPANTASSYEGQMISISHVLRLRLVSSYFLDVLAPCPKFEIPVQVMAAAPGESTELLPDCDIPAWALGITNMVVAAAVHVPSQAIAYSNDIVVEDDTVPLPPTTDQTPSVTVLLEAMKKTSNHVGLMQQKCSDKAWDPILQSLTPEDYGRIVSQVEVEFEKPGIALALASQHKKFLVAHVVAVIKQCPEWMRSSLVGQLMPLCTDLEENRNELMQHLSDWEKLVLGQVSTEAGKV